jgi:carbon-monoxide dehydrogenase large subunit
MIVEGQIHGAVAQGIGEALGEFPSTTNPASSLTGSLMDYAPAAATCRPSPRPPETPSPLTPGGRKGMGEGGTIGAPAAIANAVADAVKPLGRRITSLPILPETLVSQSSTPVS